MSLLLKDNIEDLKNKFYSLREPNDLAILLEISYKDLIYYLYRLKANIQYKTFFIPKKNGNNRVIFAPISPIKIVQKKLNQVLQAVYEPPKCTHGFVYDKSILSNANIHIKKKYVLNIDLEDFFPTINFGRIRGLFLKPPYNLPSKLATLVSQICCYEGRLPQGAPTSPIISNMICYKLDKNLSFLAFKNKCVYTRYADDISFSTSISKFPKALAKLNEKMNKIVVGDELEKTINNNGFKINISKTRLQSYTQRQEVTGVIVNKFPNVKRNFVRQIRAMVNAWKKYGIENAQTEYINKYLGIRNPQSPLPSFKKIIMGKLEFLGTIKGKDDKIFKSFVQHLIDLDPSLDKYYAKYLSKRDYVSKPLIYTEGVTDVKFLKKALSELKKLDIIEKEFDLDFSTSEDNMNDSELKKLCKTMSKSLNPLPVICIFDRDRPEIIKDVSEDNGKKFKSWGNNVFSFVLPVPKHRELTPEISIELYLKDYEIKTFDNKNRRLFLNKEFSDSSGRHLTDDYNCTLFNKLKEKRTIIIDSNVFDSQHQNVALPKNDFADYILNNVANFNNFSYAEFVLIFDMIKSILTIK